MIDTAINIISPSITNLCWVEIYCAVTRLAKRSTGGNNKDKLKVFPVSCNCTDEECWNKGRYQDLKVRTIQLFFVFTSLARQPQCFLHISPNLSILNFD